MAGKRAATEAAYGDKKSGKHHKSAAEVGGSSSYSDVPGDTFKNVIENLLHQHPQKDGLQASIENLMQQKSQREKVDVGHNSSATNQNSNNLATNSIFSLTNPTSANAPSNANSSLADPTHRTTSELQQEIFVKKNPIGSPRGGLSVAQLTVPPMNTPSPVRVDRWAKLPASSQQTENNLNAQSTLSKASPRDGLLPQTHTSSGSHASTTRMPPLEGGGGTRSPERVAQSPLYGGGGEGRGRGGGGGKIGGGGKQGQKQGRKGGEERESGRGTKAGMGLSGGGGKGAKDDMARVALAASTLQALSRTGSSSSSQHSPSHQAVDAQKPVHHSPHNLITHEAVHSAGQHQQQQQAQPFDQQAMLWQRLELMQRMNATPTGGGGLFTSLLQSLQSSSLPISKQSPSTIASLRLPSHHQHLPHQFTPLSPPLQQSPPFPHHFASFQPSSSLPREQPVGVGGHGNSCAVDAASLSMLASFQSGGRVSEHDIPSSFSMNDGRPPLDMKPQHHHQAFHPLHHHAQHPHHHQIPVLPQQQSTSPEDVAESPHSSGKASADGKKGPNRHSKYCHFCQHIKNTMVACTSGPCTFKFCHHCLSVHLHEDWEAVQAGDRDGTWRCPCCRNRCCCCSTRRCDKKHPHCKAYRKRLQAKHATVAPSSSATEAGEAAAPLT